jgi:uncharacterized protein (TIRG00374 family)
MRIIDIVHSYWDGTTTTGRRTRRLIKILFFIILFVALFWVVPIKEVFYALLSAAPLYVLIGWLLVFPVIYLGAVQLKILTRKSGIELSVFQLLAINLSIKFYMLFVPNAFVGSGMRWYKLSKPSGQTAEAFAAVAFNRLLDLFLIVGLGLGFFILSGQVRSQTSAMGLVVLVVVIASLWFVLTRVSLSLHTWMKTHFTEEKYGGRWGRLIEKIEQLLLAISVYADFSTWELLSVTTVGIVRLLLNIFSFLFMAMSVGIGLSYLNMGWIQSVVALTSMLPFTIAGGLGYREVSLVAMLATFNIGAELALAFSFLIFGRTILLGLVGGLVEATQTLVVKNE